MSVIIRLQNLPLTAKSADIRHFFGGLRIPSGGVHIIGGEKGEAFIAFNSDEDARLAMRKDGGKLIDSQVKLLLSSRMEMQYEVEKVARGSHKIPFRKSRSPTQSDGYHHPSSDVYNKFPERMYESKRSTNPYSSSRHNTIESHIRRSRSPRSRTPHRSRSPQRSHRSPSLGLKPYFPREEPYAPKFQGPNPPGGDATVGRGREMSSSYSWENSDFNNSPKIGLSTSELQAQLEKRIAEAIESNPILLSRCGMDSNKNAPIVDNAYGSFSEPPNFTPPFSHPSIPSTFSPAESNFAPNHMNEPQQYQEMSSQNPSHYGMFPSDYPNTSMTDVFYVAVSGLDTQWDFHNVQTMFNDMFLDRNHVRWEVDRGQRTGAFFVKLTNRNDYEAMMRRGTFMFYDRLITVSDCHPSLVTQYFFVNSENPMEHEGFENKDLCYALKGLPFACTQKDVISFFNGFDVADVVIFYGKNGQATGAGYVSFKNRRDFEAAYSRNKHKIFHRFIEMSPSSDYKMSLARSKAGINDASVLNPPRTRRSLCALVTGLPHFTSVKKLISFFEESGFTADAIHLTLNKKKCDGRAFIEFTNFRAFELALKLNGTRFQETYMICVKQVLYDEMVRILESQKVKHHFNDPEPIFVNKPEKVPYLWEPPDAAEEQSKSFTNKFSKKPFSSRGNAANSHRPQIDKTYSPSPTKFHDNRINPTCSTLPTNFHDNRMVQPFFPSPPNLNISMQPPGQTFVPPQNNFNVEVQQPLPPMQSFPPMAPPFPSMEQPLPPPQDTLNSGVAMNFKQNSNRNAFRKNCRVLSAIPLQTVTTPTKSFVIKDVKNVSLVMKGKSWVSKNIKKESPAMKGKSWVSKNIKKEFPAMKEKSLIIKNIKKEFPAMKEKSLIIKNIKKEFPAMKEKSLVIKDNEKECSADDVSNNKKEDPPPEDATREPIKFNVNKSSGVGATKNKTFESDESVEKKVKLSKLSPKREIVNDSATKDVSFKKNGVKPTKQDKKTKDSPSVKKGTPSEKKGTPSEKKGTPSEKKDPPSEKKDVSSEKKDAPSEKKDPPSDMKDPPSEQKNPSSDKKDPPGEKKNLPIEKKNPLIKKKNPPGAKKFFQKNKARSQKNFFQPGQFKNPVQQRGKRSRSPFRHLSPPLHMPCAVQMSNVSLDVKTADLLNFLYGFAFDAESIIRRYASDTGEPTGDVRVTFMNRKEAELAVQTLQGGYLKNMQVGMFVP